MSLQTGGKEVPCCLQAHSHSVCFIKKHFHRGFRLGQLWVITHMVTEWITEAAQSIGSPFMKSVSSNGASGLPN